MRHIGWILFVVLVGVAAVGTAPVCSTAADIEAMISAAKTPADHEAIAAYYDQEAKTASDKAALHRRMGEDYRKLPGSLSAKTHLYQHCEGLVKIYTSQAKEFTEMAAMHRELAKRTK